MKSSIEYNERSSKSSKPYRARLFYLVGLALPLMLFITLSQSLLSAGAKSSSGEAALRANNRTALSSNVSVKAAGRGNPWVNLSDGRDLITDESIASSFNQILQRHDARPLAVTSADFDEDGVADLIAGYGGRADGIICLYRGNVDSIYPNSPDALQRVSRGEFTDAPFFSPQSIIEVGAHPDFIGAGDFDADGHKDIIMASRGRNNLYLLPGSGDGSFGPSRQIELPGRVTALVIGEINRADGLADLVVAVSANEPEALVFEGPEGAINAKPESFSLTSEATTLMLGEIDSRWP
jgi:hypothetical protein